MTLTPFLPPAPPKRILIGALLLDMIRHEAMIGHQPLPLSYAERRVLEALALANGKPVSRDTLSMTALHRTLNAVRSGNDRSIDQLVHKLRRKLPKDRHGQPLIRSARFHGYWMVPGVAV